MAVDAVWLKEHVRAIPNHPAPGVVFRDITPLLAHAAAFRFVIDHLAEPFTGRRVDKVAGVEARGFVVAAPIARQFDAGFIPIRKGGKLPWEIEREQYELEYGTDLLEIHRDAIADGDHVLVVDDVLATGGTAAAACRLVERLGGTVVGLSFLLELSFLGGACRLEDREVHSLLHYDEP